VRLDDADFIDEDSIDKARSVVRACNLDVYSTTCLLTSGLERFGDLGEEWLKSGLSAALVPDSFAHLNITCWRRLSACSTWTDGFGSSPSCNSIFFPGTEIYILFDPSALPIKNLCFPGSG
jgi:hypothetical protein